MGEQSEEAVGVTLDGEIQAPPAVDSGLPDVTGLIVLLGPEGGMAEILEQESDATVHRSLDRGRRLRVVLDETLSVGGPHLLFFFYSFLASRWRERTASFADGKGP